MANSIIGASLQRDNPPRLFGPWQREKPAAADACFVVRRTFFNNIRH
jgi:hypothetical protein